MTKRIVLLILAIGYITSLIGQNNISTNVISNCYFMNNSKYDVITVKISSNGQDSWIWFDDRGNSKLNDKENIYNHFIRKNSEFSLFQLSMDANIETFTPALFSSFVKKIRFNEEFYIHFIGLSSNDFTVESLISYLKTVIRVYPERIIFKEFPQLKFMLDNKIIFYEENYITIMIKDFMKTDQD